MILTAIVFILTLGFLVISHELGHFLVAKKFGIKVLEFGFGLPPKVWSKKIGETLVSLNLLPIGGFVRLLGEDEADAKLRDSKYSFATKPVLQRLAVVLAGVTVNLVLAWILFYIVLFSLDFKIFYPFAESSTSISEVQAGYPAEQSGIKSGDKIISIDNQPFAKTDEAVQYIRGKAETPINIKVSNLDGGNVRDLVVTPKLEDNVGKIGIAFSPVPYKQYVTPTEKIFSGITFSYDVIHYTFAGLGKLFVDLFDRNLHQVSQSVAGPVGLAVITNNFVSIGWDALLMYIWFVGILSLTLSVMNALPFPALDGGRAVFLFYEMIFGKKPNAEFERIVHTAGMFLLLAAMIAITFSDISKLDIF